MFPATNTVTMTADMSMNITIMMMPMTDNYMSITMNTTITIITIRCPRMLLQAMSITSMSTRTIITTAVCMRLRISFITFRYRTR